MSDHGLSAASFASPWGPITLVTSDLGLALVELPASARPAAASPDRTGTAPASTAAISTAGSRYLARYFGTTLLAPEPNALARFALEELAAYCAGRLRRFDSPLDLRLTPFATRVLQAAAALPYGQTITYGQLAATVGAPRASRAVGWAMAHNPLPIFIPCHRVVPAGGGVGQYGGGPGLKRALLSLEGLSFPGSS